MLKMRHILIAEEAELIVFTVKAMVAITNNGRLLTAFANCADVGVGFEIGHHFLSVEFLQESDGDGLLAY